MKETSAGAIIFRADGGKTKYLLLQYGAGHWDFVKGHIEGKEKEEETMRREAAEEAGLKDLKIIKGFRETISYFYRNGGEMVSKDVIYLLAQTETPEKEVKLSFEHTGYEWLEFEATLKKVTFSSSKDVLKKADKFLKEYAKQKRLEF